MTKTKFTKKPAKGQMGLALNNMENSTRLHAANWSMRDSCCWSGWRARAWTNACWKNASTTWRAAPAPATRCTNADAPSPTRSNNCKNGSSLKRTPSIPKNGTRPPSRWWRTPDPTTRPGSTRRRSGNAS